MLENQPIATAFMGNRHALKILQVFQPILVFNVHVIAREEVGVLEHWLTMMPGLEQTIELMRKIEWNLMEEARLLSPFNECPTPDHCLVMNIIAWNCKGTLKPNFQNHV